jgi:xylulokinase
VIGLDVGTSACKGVLLDGAGRQLAGGHRSYALSVPSPGRVELDPEAVWSAAATVIRRLGRHAARDRWRIAALACSVSVDEAVLVDGRDRPLSDVIMALDTRSAGTARRWAATAGEEIIYRITGLPVHPAHPLVRLLWLREHEPERFRRVARILAWEEFVAVRSGLPPTSDPSVAARTMAWDVAAGRWSTELLDLAGLPATLFPAVRPSGSVIGEIPAAVARTLSLPDGVVLVAGGMDQAVATLGAGVTRPGQAMVGTGSWEALTVILSAAPPDTTSLRSSGIGLGPFVTGRDLTAMATQAGGGALVGWLRDVLDPRLTVGRFLRLAPDRPSGLLVLPHLEGSYSPWMDPSSRAAVAGLSLETTPGMLLRGALEGITFELRLNVERLERAGVAIDEIRCTGGGARSAAWVQLKADILGRPMVLVDVTENGAHGAAWLAGHAVGLYPTVEIAAERFARPVRTVEPHPAMATHYEAAFARYRELYPALRRAREHAIAPDQSEAALPASSRMRRS